jgi:hypothetical protein
MKLFMAIVLVLVLATSAFALEKKAYTMRDDFGTEPLYDCAMNYYYYIPCPTYSWFWAFTGWGAGDIIGTFFNIGELSMNYGVACDPLQCFQVEQIRVLDFAGYGTVYPGLFTVVFDLWCADEYGCPVGEPLWSSGPWETGYAWNYIPVDPTFCLNDCATQLTPVLGYPRILVTATMVGSDHTYPAFGFDNISTAVEVACEFHDLSCFQALYPRPYTSHYPTIHAGYYGPNFLYCPPQWFCDGRDTSPTCNVFGFIELAWRVYLICQGPTATEASTWGNIKSMYR